TRAIVPAPGGWCLDLEMKSEPSFIFVVRDDRRADLLFQTSDMTWLSYNRWPQGRWLYDLGTKPAPRGLIEMFQRGECPAIQKIAFHILKWLFDLAFGLRAMRPTSPG